MGIRSHFGEADWAHIEHDFGAWWAHELDRPLVQVTGIEYAPNVVFPDVQKHVSNYPVSVSAEEVIASVTPHLEAVRYYGDAYPRWVVDFGPGILAGFLGAPVHIVEETVWHAPSELRAPRDMYLTYRPDDAWWRRVQDVTRAAVEMWEGQVQVSHAHLGGNLDVLASLRTTENLLYDLYDAPQEVERLAQEITSVWLRYYDELDAIIYPRCRGRAPWAPIFSRETNSMLQCDFSYMISPEMFERFVMPDLTACCEHLEHGFYHLDGRGQIAHLDMLLSIPRLRGIQWIPGDGSPPPDQWPDVLRRIIAGGKLCQVYVSAQGARTIVRTLGGKGFLLVVQDQMSADEAQAFLTLLAREDIGRRG